MADPQYTGVFPVVPTIFDERGDLDLEGQLRAVDFLIDAGSNGVCILANYSEQFVLSDEERETLTRSILEHVAGRAPVIVTTSHYATHIAAARSRRAQEQGAAMVMMMAPYHGATFRPPLDAVTEFFRRVSDAIEIPIMIQDAPVSGTALSATYLAQLARDVEHISHFKIEVPGTAAKLREMIRLGGDAIRGPWDGEESITLLADLDAGANGTMPSASIPDALRKIVDEYRAGRREEAVTLYERCLPLINYENKQVGLAGCKALLKEAGIIKSDHMRHPTPALHPDVRSGFLEIARRLDPAIMHWSR